MALLLLLVVTVIWAVCVLHIRPIYEYAKLYFLATILIWAEEFLFFRVLYLYEGRLYLFADHAADALMAEFVVMLGIEPLLALLYAHYARHRPVLRATLWGAALGLVETYLLRVGAWVYLTNLWHPVLTAAFFAGFFLAVNWVSRHLAKIPDWLALYGMVLWSGMLVDILLQGVGQAWVYHVTWNGNLVNGNRLLALLFEAFLMAPLGTWISLVGFRPGGWLHNGGLWRLGIGTLTTLFAEVLLLWLGLLTYLRWSFPLSVVRETFTFLLPVGYAWWLNRPRVGVQ